MKNKLIHLTVKLPRKVGVTNRWVFNSWLHLFDRRFNLTIRIWQERPGECNGCGFKDTRKQGHTCK